MALHGALGLAALTVIQRTSRAGESAADEVDAFLERWARQTETHAGQDKPNEDEFLHRLCADLARLDPAGFPERKQVSFQADGVASGPVAVQMPFLVLQFDLDPGAVIPAHNHVGWSFLSMGVRGEAQVQHYELAGTAPEPGEERDTDFHVREVSSCLLTPGRTSSLTRTRANIHAFRAGENGARFIDFGVQFPDPGEGYRSFSALAVDDEPADRERRVYAARWLGNIYAKD